MCVNNLPTTQGRYMKVEVKPVTCRSQIQRPNHYTTMPHVLRLKWNVKSPLTLLTVIIACKSLIKHVYRNVSLNVWKCPMSVNFTLKN